MNFSQWLAANKYDEQALTAENRKHLEAAWKAELAPPPPLPDNKPPAKEPTTVDDKLAVFEAEAERKDFIREACLKWGSENTHAGAEKHKQLRALQEAAIADEKMDRNAFNLAMLRFDRTVGMMVLTPRQTEVNGDVVEAAVCMAGGLTNVEKHFDSQTLDAAHRQYKNGISLHGLIGHCARRNGWRGEDIKTNWFQAVRAAFRDEGGGGMYAATTGPSTYSLPILLGNTANKFLRDGFMSVDSSWRDFAEITRFSDFKQKTEAGLTGSLIYNKIGPSGEIKHGDISEISYTNQADTYAIMLGLDRKSIINDDLGALTGASRRMGRGYSLTLANLVYTVFINNSAFFAAGNNNVITGATSVLSGATGLEALRLAVEKFKLQTDPNGLPLGSMPKILLVPASLEISAKNLMNSTGVVGSTTANSLMPDGNPFAGNFKVVVSPYLQNSAYTGFSATAWYLLSDANDIPVLEVGFLNGVDSPTVETENAEFNMLGIALRGYFDAGVALKEFRGGVRAAGA